MFSLALDPSLILEAAGMAPDPWQAAVLRSRPRRLLLNCSRQSGKSTVTAAMAIDEAVNRPPALVLLLSPSLRQSGELFRTVMGLHRKIGIGIEPEAESNLRAELPNGSRIVALPGADEATIRGFSSVGLLIIDEAARVADALYRAVRPMLAVSGGRLAALSTPWGKRGWFYDSWTAGEAWQRVKVTAAECPRISPKFLEEERRAMPEAVFRQEYFCEFQDSAGQIFSGEEIEAFVSHAAAPAVFQGEESWCL